jgi:hypothetical protein
MIAVAAFQAVGLTIGKTLLAYYAIAARFLGRLNPCREEV